MLFVRIFLFTYLLISAFLAYGHSCHSNRYSALAGIKIITSGMEDFRKELHRYPTTSEGVEILVGSKSKDGKEQNYYYFRRLPADPWGNQYHYRYPGINNPDSFDLWTYGADGKPGGDGENADCGNWQGDDCYKEPYKDVKDALKLVLLLLMTPIFWLPVYLFFSVRNFKKKQPRKAAFSGWHLWVLVLSLLFTLASLIVPNTPGC